MPMPSAPRRAAPFPDRVAPTVLASPSRAPPLLDRVAFPRPDIPNRAGPRPPHNAGPFLAAPSHAPPLLDRPALPRLAEHGLTRPGLANPFPDRLDMPAPANSLPRLSPTASHRLADPGQARRCRYGPSRYTTASTSIAVPVLAPPCLAVPFPARRSHTPPLLACPI